MLSNKKGFANYEIIQPAKNMKQLITIWLTLFSMACLSQIPMNGLIGYYPFTGSANDLSGNNFHGLVNNAVLTTDRFGNVNCAYQFNGNSSINLSSNFDVLPRSISFWFNASMTDLTPRLLYCSDNPTLTTGLTDFGVQAITGTDSWFSSISGLTKSGPISLNTWHHAVVIVDVDRSKKYIDGQLVFSDYYGVFLTSSMGLNKTIIGADRTGFANYFFGKIDDISIYNSVLSPSEIAAIYNENICYQTITVTDTLIINTSITGFNPVTYQNSIKVDVLISGR